MEGKTITAIPNEQLGTALPSIKIHKEKAEETEALLKMTEHKTIYITENPDAKKWGFEEFVPCLPGCGTRLLNGVSPIHANHDFNKKCKAFQKLWGKGPFIVKDGKLRRAEMRCRECRADYKPRGPITFMWGDTCWNCGERGAFEFATPEKRLCVKTKIATGVSRGQEEVRIARDPILPYLPAKGWHMPGRDLGDI